MNKHLLITLVFVFVPLGAHARNDDVGARNGAIRGGGLLVINGGKFHQPGTILGKALDPLPDGVGEILALLCRGSSSHEVNNAKPSAPALRRVAPP